MQKVLMVACFFPPLGGGGVQRTLKFVKYLPEFSWQAVVLTMEPQIGQLRDASLVAEVPSSTPVHRTRAILFPRWFPWKLRKFVSRWLLLVDQQLGWLPFAARCGRALIQREGIEAIYTTSAPYTDHLIGLQLKTWTNLPWVADFRDPWLGNFAATFPTDLHMRAALRLERRVVETSDQVLVVSEPMRQALLIRHPGLASDRVLVLPNGYDPADFAGVQPLGQEDDRLVFVHTGSFYGQRQRPSHFLQGLRTALERQSVPHQQIRVYFVGNIDRMVERQIQAYGLADVVEVTGYLSHRQSIGYLLGADVLVLIIGSGPGSDAVYTGKIFEYLAVHRQILALVPPGVAADLVLEAQAGIIADPEDEITIAAQITTLYHRWQRGELKYANGHEVVARYDRRRLTATLAETLNEVCRRRA